MRRDPILGFLAGRVRRLEGALEEPQAVGSGPRDTASTVEYLAERDLGDDGGLGLALRPRRATTCLGEGWAARAIHSLRVHKREPRSQQHRWTPRGPAPSRRSITGHGAQKAGAHTLRASACATTEGAGGRVSTPPACLQRSSVGRGCRITLGAAWSGSVLPSCSVLRRRRAACWQSFGGQNSGAHPRHPRERGGGLGAC